MTRAEDVVRVTRQWIGTPYLHQGSTLGAGTDCLGLVRGIWRDLFGAEPEVPPNYTQDWAEPSGYEALEAAALRHLCPKPLCDVSIGDVLLFRMRQGRIAKHLGVQTQTGSYPKFVHAYSGHSVMEHPLSAPWARRVTARFSFPTGDN